MLARNDPDFPFPDGRMLSPEERDHLTRQIIARAEVERAKAIYALFRTLFLAWPKQFALAALRAFAAGWAAYRIWQTRRRAVAELRSLDDRHLKDIGLRRGEIESVIYGTDETRPSRDRRVSSPERSAA
jgi:uncharacterized protein YjiS (DUF1127 family)